MQSRVLQRTTMQRSARVGLAVLVVLLLVSPSHGFGFFKNLFGGGGEEETHHEHHESHHHHHHRQQHFNHRQQRQQARHVTELSQADRAPHTLLPIFSNACNRMQRVLLPRHRGLCRVSIAVPLP